MIRYLLVSPNEKNLAFDGTIAGQAPLTLTDGLNCQIKSDE